MKKTLRLVAVFALMGATLAYTGCTDYSKDFDDINNRIEALESGKLKSVEEQVAGLKSTVASLEDAKAKAEAAIAELQKNSATAADLKALEAKLDAAVKDAASKAAVEDLKSKLEKLEADLAKYAKVEALNAEVEKLNKAIADAKALTEKEFATVNDKIKAITDWQVEAVAKLGALEGQIKTLEEGLATSQQDIITLTEGLKSVSAATGILEEEVEKIYDELNKAWDSIIDLTEGLRSTTAGLAIAEQDIIALQTEMATVKEALAALKEASAKHVTADDVKAAVKTAVAEAIANDGVISAEIAKAVKAAADKLQAQIDAVKNVVKNLAEQIQSIVYVPETKDGQMSAAIYKLGTNFKTPVMIKASYEITPHELVSSISASNLCASSVKVKAAPAENFPVRILAADPATGRLDVRIDVPAESDAYKVLTAEGAPADTPSVALALNISESKISTIPGDDDTMIDTGCKKSSSYVTVDRTGAQTPVDLATAVTITKDGKAVASAVEDIPMYYDATESEKPLFEGYDIKMKIGDDLMSIEDAAEYLGTRLKLSIPQSKVTYYKGADKQTDLTKVPITVAGEFLDMTASMNDNQRGTDRIDYYVEVVFDGFTLNDKKLNIKFKSTYTITKTAQTIVYPEQEVIMWHYNLDNKAATFYTDFNEDVIGLGTVTGPVNLERFVYYTDTQEWKKEDSSEKDEKATPKVDEEEGNYEVTGKIMFENLRFTPGKDVKYVVNYTINNDALKKDYEVKCTVYLKGMPGNKTINLGTVNAVRNYTSDFVYDQLTPIAKAYEIDKSYYNSDLNSVSKFIEKFGNHVAKNATIKINGTTYDDMSTAAASFTISTEKVEDVYVETATLKISPALQATKDITIECPITKFGVTYTYKVKVVVTEPDAYTLQTKPYYVDSNNIAWLKGKYTFGSKDSYSLDAIMLNNYLSVNGPADETFQVWFYRMSQNDKGKWIVAEGTTPTMVDVVKGQLKETKYPDYTDKTVAFHKLTANLVMTNNNDKVVDSKVITLQPIDVIKSLTTKEVTVDPSTSVKLFNNISVVDYDGNSLVCSIATTQTDMWSSVKNKVDDKGKPTGQIVIDEQNYYDVYGQKVTYGTKEEVVIKHNGVAISNTSDIKYSIENGVLTLSAETAQLQGTLTFEIPVKLTYIYGGSREETLKVNFKRAAAE